MDERNTEPLSPRVYALKLHTAYVVGGVIAFALVTSLYTYSNIDDHHTNLAIKRSELDIANVANEHAKHDVEVARANEAAAMWNHMQCVPLAPPPAEKKP